MGNNLRYKQPQNLHISSGNFALDSKLIEKAHNADKHLALTNKQERTLKRKEDCLNLASQGILYCNKSNQFITPEIFLEKFCHISHGKRPVCKYLYYKNGILRPYRK